MKVIIVCMGKRYDDLPGQDYKGQIEVIQEPDVINEAACLNKYFVEYRDSGAVLCFLSARDNLLHANTISAVVERIKKTDCDVVYTDNVVNDGVCKQQYFPSANIQAIRNMIVNTILFIKMGDIKYRVREDLHYLYPYALLKSSIGSCLCEHVAEPHSYTTVETDKNLKEDIKKILNA